jgi:hypothetical protein
MQGVRINVQTGEATQIEVADEPVIVPQTVSITFAQLLIGLEKEQWISEAEGDAWAVGTLPSAVMDLIAQLPADQRFAARTRARRPSVVLRNDPLVTALGALQGKTPAQLDVFFNTYGAV